MIVICSTPVNLEGWDVCCGASGAKFWTFLCTIKPVRIFLTMISCFRHQSIFHIKYVHIHIRIHKPEWGGGAFKRPPAGRGLKRLCIKMYYNNNRIDKFLITDLLKSSHKGKIQIKKLNFAVTTRLEIDPWSKICRPDYFVIHFDRKPF